MSEVQQLIADVERARRDFLSRVSGLSAEQGAFKPSAGEWSVVEITEHLVHAEQGGINLMWKAADGVRRGRPVWTGAHLHIGLAIEDVVARTWQSKETAPASATPRIGGPIAYWAAALAACQPLLEMLGRELEDLDLSRVIHPHVISGPLDARQRLQFLRFHLDRHRSQVDRVLQLAR